MGLFNNYYLYNRYVKAINPILLIDMSTSLLPTHSIHKYCKRCTDKKTNISV